MISARASMRAWASDWSMSNGARRRSNEIDALSAWKSGSWGSEKRATAAQSTFRPPQALGSAECARMTLS